MKKEPKGVLATIKQIQSGVLAPNTLGVEARRRCVEHLTAEGVSVPEMANLLSVSERTISRDRAEIHKANALKQDPELAGQVAGRLMIEAERCVGRIRRVTREANAPHAVRVDGERQVYSILSQMTERLQSLGYLPEAARRVEADVAHRLEGVLTDVEIQAEITRMLGDDVVKNAKADDVKALEDLRDAAKKVLPLSTEGDSHDTAG